MEFFINPDVLRNRCSLKFRKFHWKKHLYWSLSSTGVFSCEIYEIFKNTCFMGTHPVTASAKNLIRVNCNWYSWIEELFMWGETSHLGGTSHVTEILFIPRLHEKNIPPEWDTFYPSLYAYFQFVLLSFFPYFLVFISISSN